MSGLRDFVAEIFDGWCERLVSHLDDPALGLPRASCERCATSRMIPVLGDFGSLPHHLVHPLVGYLDQVLDSRVENMVEEGKRDLRSLWLDRVDVDADGRAPTAEWVAEMTECHEFELAALEMIAMTWRTIELGHICELLADLCVTYCDVARYAVARVVDATVQIAESGDVDETGMTVIERRVLERATRDVLEDWIVWLPRPEWTSGGEIPAGRRCSRCAGLGLDIQAPHLVVHRLAELVDELVDGHVAEYGRPRAEPPGDGRVPEFRVAVRDAVVGGLLAESATIERAIALYIQPLVDEVVGSASAYLDVIDESGERATGD